MSFYFFMSFDLVVLMNILDVVDEDDMMFLVGVIVVLTVVV